MNNAEEWAKNTAALLKKAMAEFYVSVNSKLDSLEKRVPEKGEPGQPGANCSHEQVAAAVKEFAQPELDKFFAGIAIQVDELKKSFAPVTMDDLRPHADVFLQKNMGAKFEEIDLLIAESREKVSAIIAGVKNGKDGENGKSLTVADIEPLIEAHVSRWALSFERRAQDVLTRAVDKFPLPKDGLGFDDISVEDDGAGLVKIKFIKGETEKEFTIRLPVLLYRGVFDEKQKETYKSGHCVTWHGSIYISKSDKPEGAPREGSEFWQLAVKHGRNAEVRTRPLAPRSTGPVSIS